MGASAPAGYNHRSWRCRYCEVCWPLEDDYKNCPACREECRRYREEPDMAEAEAASEKVRAEFGWYLVSQWLDPEASLT